MTCQKKQVPEVEIDGIRINAFPSVESTLGYIFPQQGAPYPGYAVAVNPEKIMAARNDPQIRAVLESATVRVADGMGVVWTMRRRTTCEVRRVTGYDLWNALMAEAGRRKVGVYLVGAKEEVVVATRTRLQDAYGVNVIGHQDGYFTVEKTQALITQIGNSGATIVCVAMGSPRQEHFIRECRKSVPNAFYIGVGGSFDVYSGRLRRAPKWIQAANMEWAYRIAQTPTLKRASRLVPALKFAWLSVTNQL
jgi:UDP-N-acetyl-D-mannosaminouronate:lipid I N-acetyl-D-mannosaminouronosyltransferase